MPPKRTAAEKTPRARATTANQFELIFEASPNAFVAINRSGVIELVNQQAEKMFGYSREELLGQPIEMLVPPRFRPNHPHKRSDYFTNPTARSMGAGRDLFGFHKDGTEFPVEIGLNPLRTGRQTLALAAIVNISERKQIEEVARQAALDTEAINKILFFLSTAGSVETATYSVLDMARELFHWDYAVYWTVDEGKGALLFKENAGSTTEKLRSAFRRAELRAGDGLCGTAWEKQDVVHIPDIAELRKSGWVAEAQQAGIQSALALPIIAKKRPIGIMQFVTAVPKALSSERLDSMRTVSRITSAAVERLSDEERTHQLLKGITENIQALAAASEELTSVSQQLTGNADQTKTQASSVLVSSEQVSKHAQTVSTSVEDLGASIREIAKSAHEAATVATKGVSVAKTTTSTVGKLGESSAEIGKVLKVITSIAEQTNLLALNATIEAARAGEAGRGFAVVANEVKELARETAHATEDIGQKIEDIQDVTCRAVEAIDEISKIIVQINDYQTTIATAVEQQSATAREIGNSGSDAAAGSAEIARSIASVAHAALGTAEGSDNAQQAARELARMAVELQRLVEQFQAGH